MVEAAGLGTEASLAPGPVTVVAGDRLDGGTVGTCRISADTGDVLFGWTPTGFRWGKQVRIECLELLGGELLLLLEWEQQLDLDRGSHR